MRSRVNHSWATRSLASSIGRGWRVGVGQPGPDRLGVGGVEPLEPERSQLDADRVGADGDRAAGEGRLDRRVPEALPGAREGDQVGSGVEVGPVGERLVDHPATGRRRASARARARSPPRPARAASRWRRAARTGGLRQGRPCGGWPEPGGPRAARRVRRRARPGAVAIAARGWCPCRAGGEAVVDRGGRQAPIGELALGEPVDGHVAPGRVVGGQLGDVGEPLALPGRIVVVEDRRASGQHLRRGSRGR